MNENFRDAVHHLRWAGRHTIAGIRTTVAPYAATVRSRLPVEDATAPEGSPIETVPDRVVAHLKGARHRLGR